MIQLTKPVPNYRLQNRTRKAILFYLRNKKEMIDFENSEVHFLETENLLTIDMLRLIQNESDLIRNFGKVCRIDVANKILCLEFELPTEPKHIRHDAIPDTVTRRDYFAAMAMQPLLTQDFAMPQDQIMNHIAKSSYEAADAMIEAGNHGLFAERSNMIQFLERYSNWLESQGFMDTDWRTEEPFAIDEFIKSLP